MDVPSVIAQRYKGYLDVMGKRETTFIAYEEGSDINELYD